MEILSRRYRKSPDLVFRQIAGEFVLVPIRHDVADLEAVYTLAEWVRVSGVVGCERDGYAILGQIVEEYEVTSEEARTIWPSFSVSWKRYRE